MNEFYKNLKAIREEQGISLDEIHERTKINKSVLSLIEDGKFEDLNRTYLRLFLRAYCNEIGVNPDDALENLKEHLNTGKESVEEIKKDKLEPKKFVKKEFKEGIGVGRSSKNIRSDIIKGSILITILIFAIYIIRQINEEEMLTSSMEQSSQFIEEEALTNDILVSEYDILYESTFALEEVSPFTIRMITEERNWYSYKIDSLSSINTIIPVGDSHLYEFDESIRILFKHTKSLNLYLNNVEISSLEESSTPLIISISSINKNIRIQRFVPKLN